MQLHVMLIPEVNSKDALDANEGLSVTRLSPLEAETFGS